MKTLLVLCVGAITAPSGFCPAIERPDAIEELINDSRQGLSAQHINLLSNNPLNEKNTPQALEYIKARPDFTSYLLLVAVNRYSPNAYSTISDEDKATILCSALRNAVAMNDWGHLTDGGSNRIAADMLLEVGRPCLGLLAEILDDGEPAYLFGSKDATASFTHNYRRKDFAYRYIALILGENPTFDKDVKVRDKAIAIIKTKVTNLIKREDRKLGRPLSFGVRRDGTTNRVGHSMIRSDTFYRNLDQSSF